MISNLPAGIFLASMMTMASGSALKTTKRLLHHVCNTEDDDDIDMKGTTLGGDCGYQDDELQKQYTPKHNLNAVYTTKCGLAMPWKFGETHYKSL